MSDGRNYRHAFRRNEPLRITVTRQTETDARHTKMVIPFYTKELKMTEKRLIKSLRSHGCKKDTLRHSICVIMKAAREACKIGGNANEYYLLPPLSPLPLSLFFQPHPSTRSIPTTHLMPLPTLHVYIHTTK